MPARARRRSYSLRSKTRVQNDSSERKSLILDNLLHEHSPTPDSSSVEPSTAELTTPPSEDSACCTSSTSPQNLQSLAQTPQQSSAKWTSSFRSFLKKSPKSPVKQPALATALSQPNDGVSLTAPETEEEIDAFLSDIWQSIQENSKAIPVSQYIKKVTKLKENFDHKMSEITQREVTCVSELLYCDDTTPLIVASQLAIEDRASLRKTLMESKIGYKFDELRFNFKQETAQTILGLRLQHDSHLAPKKIQKLKAKTAKLLNEWYERHLDDPYPSKAEMQLLASQSGATVEQLAIWLYNKRSSNLGSDKQKAVTRTL